jgi:uncharacterized protein
MTINEQIDRDFKQALKEKNDIVLSSLRNLKAEIKNVEIAKRKELSEEEIAGVVVKKAKQHKDSIESFSKGGRSDLVAYEESQLKALQKYMPEQLGEEEIRLAVKEIVSEMGEDADFGKVMGRVMGKLKGKADGSIVSKVVKEELA